MLKIVVPGEEQYDAVNNKFFTVNDEVLRLEHSLVSLSKWESEHEIPFLGEDAKTPEQTLDYIRCMTIDEDPSPDIYERLTQENVKSISDYIDRKMTATWFVDQPGQRRGRSSEVITSELIYYWMVALQIPFECQNWHLKRLLTLIQVCNLKNQPAKKMSRRDAMAQQRSLNAARKAKMGSSG